MCSGTSKLPPVYEASLSRSSGEIRYSLPIFFDLSWPGEKLAALGPRPRVHLTRFHGVLGEDAVHGAQKTVKPPVEALHEAPSKVAETERIPSSIPKDVAQYSVGKFTVQVGSFANKVEAEKKSSELVDKGYRAFVIPAHVKGKSWFRVSVGLFATEKEAKECFDASYLSENRTSQFMLSVLLLKDPKSF